MDKYLNPNPLNTGFREEHMISIKTYTHGKDFLVAACDTDLLGRTFSQGDLCLTVTPEFYDDQRGDENMLQHYLHRATIANLVGKKVITYTLKQGYITKENIVHIQGIPHAQFLIMENE